MTHPSHHNTQHSLVALLISMEIHVFRILGTECKHLTRIPSTSVYRYCAFTVSVCRGMALPGSCSASKRANLKPENFTQLK